MNKDTRNAIERATQRSRKLLEEDFYSQLEGTFDVLRSGSYCREGRSAPVGSPGVPAGQDRRCDRAQACRRHDAPRRQ